MSLNIPGIPNKIESALLNADPDAILNSISYIAITLIENQKSFIDPKNMEIISTAALRASISAHINAWKEIEEKQL